jgi:hypothetical protein
MQDILDNAQGDPPAKYPGDKAAEVLKAIQTNNPGLWPDPANGVFRTVGDDGLPSDNSPEMQAKVFIAWVNQQLDNYLIGFIRAKAAKEAEAKIEAELAKYKPA